jgi:hypothetical protein
LFLRLAINDITKKKPGSDSPMSAGGRELLSRKKEAGKASL